MLSRLEIPAKDHLEEAADNWHAAAQSSGYLCERCGEIPPYEERKIFFECGLCGWCRNQVEKDD